MADSGIGSALIKTKPRLGEILAELRKHNSKCSFPKISFAGFTKDYGSNLAFVKKKFHEESSPRRQRMIYTHETCATGKK